MPRSHIQDRAGHTDEKEKQGRKLQRPADKLLQQEPRAKGPRFVVTGNATWGPPRSSHPPALSLRRVSPGMEAGMGMRGALTSDLSRCVLTDSTFR